jgi:hypothetical protein
MESNPGVMREHVAAMDEGIFEGDKKRRGGVPGVEA